VSVEILKVTCPACQQEQPVVPHRGAQQIDAHGVEHVVAVTAVVDRIRQARVEVPCPGSGLYIEPIYPEDEA
jgi:hypothetical protein